MLDKHVWDTEKLGPLSLEAVTLLHQPALRYLIKKQNSAAHTPFSGGGVNLTLYVISGSCTVALDHASQPVLVGEGEFCKIPEGAYVMSFPEPVEIIKVFELPEKAGPWRQAQRAVQADGPPARARGLT